MFWKKLLTNIAFPSDVSRVVSVIKGRLELCGLGDRSKPRTQRNVILSSQEGQTRRPIAYVFEETSDQFSEKGRTKHLCTNVFEETSDYASEV